MTTDLSVPFTNNEAERAMRPVKIQQPPPAAAGSFIDFAIV
ncbi:transposase [Saccharopolyspora sp. K220]|nr:transposase [Saccharopolyspora soli]